MATVVIALTAVRWVTNTINRYAGGDYAQDGISVVHYDVDSRLTGRTMHETALVPDDAAGQPPILLLFHGRGGNSEDWARPELIGALAALGDRAPVVVGVDGGDHSYYHDRADGRWGSYVVDEVIPDAVRRFGADPRRVAVGGHSMGGFAAFDVALQHPGRFCAAGGHEPAIWRTGGETAPGAFDDADDFARHDLVGAARSRSQPFGATRLWLDRGDQDFFIRGDEAFIAALRDGGSRIRTRVWPGGHGMDYLWPHIREPLEFYAKELAQCQ